MESDRVSGVWGVSAGSVLQAVDAAVLGRPALDPLEEVSVTCLLWKAVHKLSVVQQLLPSPQAVCTLNYQSLHLRMTTPRRLSLPEDTPSDSVLLLTHLQKCRYFLQTVLEETLYELSYQGSCYFLEYVLCCDNLLTYDNIVLKQDSFDLNLAIEYLKDKLIVVRENFEKMLLYFSEMTGPCLERAVVSASVQAETVIMLTDFNEHTRVNQNQYRRREIENSVRLVLEKTNNEIEDENKISIEIENQILLMTSDLQKKFDRWTKRYNREIESLDVALLQLKSKLDEQREKYQTLLQTYNDKKEELVVLQEEANIRDKEQEIMRIRNKAATVIQAWWRRYLFNRLIEKKIMVRNLMSGKKGKNKKEPKVTKKRKK